MPEFAAAPHQLHHADLARLRLTSVEVFTISEELSSTTRI
jgi:hypothetical protein